MVQTTTRIDRADQPGDPSNSIETLATSLANRLHDSKTVRGHFPIPARLKKMSEFFQGAYSYFSDSAKTQILTSNAAEWLLDNFYVLEQAVREVEKDLPASYYYRLPQTADAMPRIQIVAMAIVQRGAVRLDVEQIRNFVQEFQNETPLRVGELWALPLMLRLSVLEALADGLADLTKLKWNAAPESTLLASLTSESGSPEADPETKVVNSILNLRLFATLDWKTFFETTSVLERILRHDPAEAYAQSDFETRNQYRSIVEELAQGSTVPEDEITSKAIELAEKGGSPREKHVGYYLIDEGRRILENAISFRPTLRGRFLNFVSEHATVVYLGSIFLITLIIFA
jgi:cyclic beta-1,2-glucan synthetase